ncbi:MAG: Flp1 family type IVb pilin [Clostridia bacterium]|jgi:Flp pilus assembly pilin Flp
MIKILKSFIEEEDGMSTVEVVIIIAVLVGVALIFRKQIFDFIQNVAKKIFDEDTITNKVGYGNIDGG